MDNSSPTYYDLLEIASTASLSEIRQAFRRLARRYHPDVNPGDRTALERFQQISQAYQVLSDPTSRNQYDQTLVPVAEPTSVDSFCRTAAEWFQHGLQLAQQGCHREAIKHYTQALALNPQLLEALNQRGFSYYKLQHFVEAFADYAEALTLNDQQATSYYYRGLIRFKLGYSQGAIADFSQAIAIEPDHGQAYYHRGLAYNDLNERYQAQQNFQVAEQLFLKQGNISLANDAHIAHRQTARDCSPLTILQNFAFIPGNLILVLFWVITSPRQCVSTSLNRLPLHRTILLTLTLIIGFESCFIHTVNSLWPNFAPLGLIESRTMAGLLSLATLIGVGLVPFIVLTFGSVLTQVLTRQQVSWRASSFLASVSLLPLSGIIFTFAVRQVSMAVFWLTSMVAGGYLILILYGGCRCSLRGNHAIATTSAICLTGIIMTPILLTSFLIHR